MKRAKKRGLIFDKNGELTSSQIIGIALAIIGFVIVLLFFVVLDFNKEASDEACRVSVLTRATAPDISQGYLPLKCTTKKVCLSDGSGECDKYMAGEETTEIKIDKEPAKAADKVEETIADEMLRCWSLMGEGKLNFFTKGVESYFSFRQKDIACVVCARVAVEHEKVNDVWNVDKEGKIGSGGVDVSTYIANTPVSNGDKTYLEILSNGDFASYASVQGINVEKIQNEIDKIEDKKNNAKVDFGDTASDEMAVLFTQIKVDDYTTVLNKLAGAGAVGAGGAFVFGGVGALKLLSSTTTLVIAIPAALGITTMSMVNTYIGRTTAAGYCGEIGSSVGEGNEKEDGCSVVQVVPYDADVINKMCGFIEGSP